MCCPSFSSRPRPIMPSTPMAWSRPDHHSGWSSVASRRRHRFGHEHDWTSCVVLTASKSTTVPSRGHGHREEARDVGPGYRPPRNLSASIRSRVAPRTLTGVLAPWRPSLSRFVRFGRVARVTALNFSIDFEVLPAYNHPTGCYTDGFMVDRAVDAALKAASLKERSTNQRRAGCST